MNRAKGILLLPERLSFTFAFVLGLACFILSSCARRARSERASAHYRLEALRVIAVAVATSEQPSSHEDLPVSLLFETLSLRLDLCMHPVFDIHGIMVSSLRSLAPPPQRRRISFWIIFIRFIEGKFSILAGWRALHHSEKPIAEDTRS